MIVSIVTETGHAGGTESLPVDNVHAAGRRLSQNRTRTARTVGHRSFRDQLAFSIGFAVTRSAGS
jgi:hypothetical protein